jgi:hypothetical protein
VENEHDFPVEECIGCGYCCLKGICCMGYMLLNTSRPVSRCPFLIWSEVDKRYWCEAVIRDPRRKSAVAIGAGCSSSLFNEWRKEVKYRG